MDKITMTLAALLMAGPAFAQSATTGTTGTTGTPGAAAPGATSNAPMPGVSSSTGVTPNTGIIGRNTGPAAAAGDRNQAVTTTSANAPQPARGSNSFTAGEARRRMERSGFSNVTGLKKDDGGVWRGTATKSGTSGAVWLDYKGNIGQSDAAMSSTSGMNGTTMGTNPPGTAVSRGVDRTLGTNATGTNPAGTSAISR